MSDLNKTPEYRAATAACIMTPGCPIEAVLPIVFPVSPEQAKPMTHTARLSD
jgi:hypothetical protein